MKNETPTGPVEKRAKLFVVEFECGGHRAAGGGCGAPLGTRVLDEAAFAAVPGPVYTRPSVHHDDELASDGIYPERVSGWKVVLKPCSGCRETC